MHMLAVGTELRVRELAGLQVRQERGQRRSALPWDV